MLFRVGASVSSLSWVHTGGTDIFPGFDLSAGLIGATDGLALFDIVPTGSAGGTLTIPQATHGLGTGYKKRLPFFDASNDTVITPTNVNPTTGDIVLSTNLATFDGAAYIV